MATKKEYKCKKCGTVELIEPWRFNRRKNKGYCKKCSRQIGADKYKEIKVNNPDQWSRILEIKSKTASVRHSSRSEQERIEHAKKMRRSVQISGKELRRRQQLFIDNAGEEYYTQYCKKRRKIALEFHQNMTESEKEIHYKKVLKNNGRSKEAEIFFNYLDKIGIQCITEHYIHGFIVDGLIRDTNIIIEYYGDVFHCNPKQFKTPSQQCSWLGGRTVQEQWDRDKKRLAALYRYGFIVIIVWGSDWKNNAQLIINRIKHEMSKN